MKTKALIPEYLKDFNCLGTSCEDTCCIGFHVPVGKQTYDYYQTLGNSDIEKKIKETVHVNPNRRNDQDYGRINATCGCPFLNEDKLCSIQLTLGEDVLSTACSKYPKQTNVVNKKMERSATLSCPEVARMVLFNKEGLQFIEHEEEVDVRDVATIVLDTNMLPMTNYFYELRDFTMRVLRNREMDLTQRMYALRLFYKQISMLIDEGKEYLIPTVIESYLNGMFEVDGDFDTLDYSGVIPTLLNLQDVHPFVPRYEITFNEMLRGFSEGVFQTGEDYLSKNEYILENYLLNYVFKTFFPFSYGDNVYQAYQMMQLHFDLLCLHIIGVGKLYETLENNTVVRIVQSWVKEAEHNSLYLKKMFSLVI